MNDADDELRQQLANQPLPRPPHGLAARIVQAATAQPQRQPWYRAVHRWRYGWPVKVAGLALCAALGVLAGHWATPATDDDMQIAAHVMGGLLWTDER
ncbi:hypothetical protein SAMN03159443_01616 [Pseudomonas sp. NFACC15-1]|uniref:hypothetical protein n=1 Tax=unclassified Pseudomonas TaxID=196821 RepID=UPI00088FBC3D|nr:MULTISPECIES: hypothetical protein [unclassified Pseudomonas]SDA60225.1 hypothetical protein SAMN03159443_01616 [Pseudomonas sp. NFACC15-1]SDB57089.1 hypothetical protein SAMN03159290_04449 [Pseudomonas sp. NFACC13-1]SDX84002.1 hypothetical protein SAMN03159380_02962 [Pseudomonas sp. NFACC14]